MAKETTNQYTTHSPTFTAAQTLFTDIVSPTGGMITHYPGNQYKRLEWWPYGYGFYRQLRDGWFTQESYGADRHGLGLFRGQEYAPGGHDPLRLFTGTKWITIAWPASPTHSVLAADNPLWPVNGSPWGNPGHSSCKTWYVPIKHPDNAYAAWEQGIKKLAFDTPFVYCLPVDSEQIDLVSDWYTTPDAADTRKGLTLIRSEASWYGTERSVISHISVPHRTEIFDLYLSLDPTHQDDADFTHPTYLEGEIQNNYLKDRFLLLLMNIAIQTDGRDTPIIYHDFVTTLPFVGSGNWNGWSHDYVLESTVDHKYQNFSLPPGLKDNVRSVIHKYAPSHGSFPGYTMGAESLLPNYTAYLLFQETSGNTPYGSYLRQYLSLNLGEDDWGGANEIKAATYQAAMMTSLAAGKIKWYYANFNKWLTGRLKNTQDDPWSEFSSHLRKCTNVVMMQSTLKLMQEKYGPNNSSFPVMLQYNTKLPFEDMWSHANWHDPLDNAISSLVEALDHNDMDYVLLKAIVENTVEYNQPAKHGLHSDGLVSEEDMDNYIINPITKDRFMNYKDKIHISNPYSTAKPNFGSWSVKWSGSDANNLKSFILYGEPILWASLPSPFLQSPIRLSPASFHYTQSWTSALQGTPLGYHHSFVDLISDYFSDGTGPAGSGFEFLSSDIFDMKCDHIFLDLPGAESNFAPEEHVKREMAEDPAAYSGWGSTGSGLDKFDTFLNDESEGDLATLKSLVKFSTGPYSEHRTRDFAQILDGRKAYSEIIYFRIEKYYVNSDGAERFVQNIYVPNAPDFYVKRYIDTQLLPDTTYSYRIYAWLAIFGTSYSYSLSGVLTDELKKYYNSNTYGINHPKYKSQTAVTRFLWFRYDSFLDYLDSNDDDFKTTHLGWKKHSVKTNRAYPHEREAFKVPITVESTPIVKCIEIPYDDLGGRVPGVTVVSDHPVAPNVEIVPYENTNNTLLFMLSSRRGATSRDFIIGINPEDEEEVALMWTEVLTKADAEAAGGDVQFEFANSEDVKIFEVYRLDQKPTSYSDFSEGVITHLVPFAEGGPPDPLVEIGDSVEKYTVSSVSYKDNTIVPNKKYYYTFRVVDKNDKFSNPTPVYEIEIVDDKGTVYPIIDIVDFDIENDLQATKNMKQYMFIAPTLEQTEIKSSTIAHAIAHEESAGKLLDLHPEHESKLVGLTSDHQAFSGDGTNVNEYFKIRLNSKKTGKKVDFNLRFKHKHIVTEEQEESEKI